MWLHFDDIQTASRSRERIRNLTIPQELRTLPFPSAKQGPIQRTRLTQIRAPAFLRSRLTEYAIGWRAFRLCPSAAHPKLAELRMHGQRGPANKSVSLAAPQTRHTTLRKVGGLLPIPQEGVGASPRCWPEQGEAESGIPQGLTPVSSQYAGPRNLFPSNLVDAGFGSCLCCV